MAVDFNALAKEVDEIDTSFLTHDDLSTDQGERLMDILSDLAPYLQGAGVQEDVTSALEIATKITRILNLSGHQGPPERKSYDTSVCQLCGVEFTGTENEIKAWEPLHIKETHPDYWIRNLQIPQQHGGE